MQIALFRSKTVISRIIRFICRSPYSHVAMILDDGSIVEAREFRGVRHLPSLQAGMRPKDEVDVFDFKTNAKQRKIITDFLLAQVGKKYDYFSVLCFIFPTTKEARKSLGKWFCGEIIMAATQKAKVCLLNVLAWITSPAMISWSPKIKFCKTVTSSKSRKR